jgi:WD40 repeat protein
VFACILSANLALSMDVLIKVDTPLRQFTVQVLLSAAEDRSVRVWRCMSENDIANENSAQDACLSQLVLVSTLWGHAARIWGCDVFQDVVSTASEDGCFTRPGVNSEPRRV